MRPRRPGAVVVAATAAISVLSFAGCRYSYSNPAERLRAGQVSGRAVADLHASGTLEPAGGVSVSIKGSAFDQVTHETGRFTMIPLPVGRHTLLFRRGVQDSLLRVVDVGLGPGGQPDGVALGDVVLPGAASVAGRPVGAPGAEYGIAVDETSGGTATIDDSTLRFRLDGLSLGDHLLRIGLLDRTNGIEWVGGPVPVRLADGAQGSVTPLADIPVHRAATATGKVRFRLVSLHDGLAPASFLLAAEELLGPTPVALPAPSADGDVEVDLPEGIYRFRIAAPPPFDAEVTPPQPATAVVIAGEVADLGALYLVPPGIPAAAQLVCEAPEDCAGATGTCEEGACQGWSAPQAAPARLPICPLRGDVCGPGQSCTASDGSAGMCLAPNRALQVCVPCGTDCTPDGTRILHGGC